MLYRLRCANQQWGVYPDMLLNENRWRAMRYGLDEGLLDLARGELVPCAALLAELRELVREDAIALGCWPEIKHTRVIAQRGTNAHRQVGVYNAANARGASEREALIAVVDWLVAETASGLD